MRLKTLIACTAVGAVLILAGCGSNNSGSAASSPSPTMMSSAAATTSVVALPANAPECTADDIKVTGAFGQAPTITIPTTCAPPKKLIIKDLSEGTGPGAVSGQPLTMNYSLVTWSDRQKLDSSFDRGQPFQLVLGKGQVIQGWDQGLVGIKQGGRRLLIVPPDLGYGGTTSNGVAANETLVFVTDAVAVGK